MRCISVEGKTVTIERGFLLFKWTEKYEATKNIAGDFHRWVKLPNRTLASALLGFQLDEFYRHGKK